MMLSPFQNMVDNFDSMVKRIGDEESEPENSELKAMDNHPDDDSEVDTLEDLESLEPGVNLKPTQIGITTFTWPQHAQQTWSGRASVIKKKLFLNGFHHAVNQYFRAQSASASNAQNPNHEKGFDPQLDVFNSIRISYPSWFPDEVSIDVMSLSEVDRRNER